MNARGLFLFAALLTAFAGPRAARAAAVEPTVTVEEESSGLTLTVEKKEEARAEPARLSVDADVPRVEVYLDGVYLGRTPLSVPSVEPGLRRLFLYKDGYYPKALRVRAETGKEFAVYAEMRRVTGIVSVRDAPAGAEFEVAGTTTRDPLLILPEGSHLLIIRAFGFEEKTVAVTVDRRFPREIDGTLARAAFSVASFRASRAAFNPLNPAGLGAVTFAFRATARGAGTVTVSDDSGAEVAQFPVGPFATWDQGVVWDGRDGAGMALPDGIYRATLRAWSLPEAGAQNAPGSANNPDPSSIPELESSVRIDRGIAYPYHEPYPGIASIGVVPSAGTLPTGALSLACDLAVFRDGPALGVSGTYGARDWLEIGFRAGTLLVGETEGILDAAGSVKVGIERELGSFRGHASLGLRYAARSGDQGTSLTRAGLALAPAFELSRGPAALSLGFEIVRGDERGALVDAATSISAGLAARYRFGLLILSLWGAGTGDLDALEDGISASGGVGAVFLVPATSFTVFAHGIGTYDDENGAEGGIRLGFGLLF
ncbi:MAG TPA: PEGA domain-containing protein [Treponemataceae bacterium]|nr:PEGA domain-containing protein [Treponemataceae bacterium]